MARAIQLRPFIGFPLIAYIVHAVGRGLVDTQSSQ